MSRKVFNWCARTAELELGGPRAFPVIVCLACVAELELGGPRAFPVTVCVARTAELELGGPRISGPRGAVEDQNSPSLTWPGCIPLRRGMTLSAAVDSFSGRGTSPFDVPIWKTDLSPLRTLGPLTADPASP